MKPPKTDGSSNEGKMPIVAHLAELRRRLIVCVVALAAGFSLSYAFSQQILAVLIVPIKEALGSDGNLSILKVQEAFMTHIKVAFMAAIIIAFPIIVHQVWAFVLPALKKKEAKVGLTLILFSTLLFAVGILFAYFTILPYAFTFFLGSAQGIASPNISLAFYVGFCARVTLAFGLVFQMPLIIVFLVRMGIVSLEQVKRARKYAIVFIFVVAAILTPPDILTQFLMAIPLLILYEISIIAAKLLRKRD
ncbi:MAG: twin-arginine translocase subunit TatC [Candidatus Coatesbacteria bacterium]|nr:twin-arginine translocase subunit TatC [Candidatus Coatesbacteria bacterium]